MGKCSPLKICMRIEVDNTFPFPHHFSFSKSIAWNQLAWDQRMLYSDGKKVGWSNMLLHLCHCLTAKSPESFRAPTTASRFCLEALLLFQSGMPACIPFQSVFSVSSGLAGVQRCKGMVCRFCTLEYFTSACRKVSALAKLFHPITEEAAPLKLMLMSHSLEFRT